MIESISITKEATYGASPSVLTGLSQFNFIYGSNGTGKTTISRVIADELKYATTCQIRWKNGTKLEPMVYNRDFVDRNFNQSPEFKGVFTLGETDIKVLDEIASTKAEVNALTGKIETLTKSLQGEDGQGGKNAEQGVHEEEFRKRCWALKQKYDGRFAEAFKGVRDKADKFKARVLTEVSANQAVLLTLAELEKKAETLFGSTPVQESMLPILDGLTLSACESNQFLQKPVIGKEDVDIASMIQKLGNSDWVKAGRLYYEANQAICPFCQQKTDEQFAKSLNEYFDDAFEKDSKAILALEANFKDASLAIKLTLAEIESVQSKFIDNEKFKSGKLAVESRLTSNELRIKDKKMNPSQKISLEPFAEVLQPLVEMITSANNAINEHNAVVTNFSQEHRRLVSQIWKYILDVELAKDLKAYTLKKGGIEKAISGITNQIFAHRSDIAKKTAEIRILEKQTTSIQPTIDDINGMLKSYGFCGFSLAPATNGKCYKLIRSDGSNAKESLSEGEKTFVTFLYFYHLLKGSESDSGVTADRIVVFDDPVSSLDSDILFIVSHLIKGLFDQVRSAKCMIKQVFVLTHNVYFHKEVSFNPKRPNNAVMSEETFWIVRKHGMQSLIEPHTSNPIKTSYDLLWEDVRKPHKSSLTLQNTLRKILQNYFEFMGSTPINELYKEFDGKDQLICKSMISWAHDGSHFAQDDVFVSQGGIDNDTYLNVFKQIFANHGHESHYNMMMGI